jgi:O-antigen/teichoic acid export membrane protein
VYKSLFKQTLIYGMASVLPRIISFILTPTYVEFLPDKSAMGDVTILFSYLVFWNVMTTYGMETAFFRFYTRESDPKRVQATALWSLLISTFLLLTPAWLFRDQLAAATGIGPTNLAFALGILAFDTWAAIPFALLRVDKKPLRYAVIKIGNVSLMFLLTIWFLMFLPQQAQTSNFFAAIYVPHFEIGYVFLANLAASVATFLAILPTYKVLRIGPDWALWKKMMRYGFPILIAGLAFAINEHFDKILLDWMQVPKADIGAYSACYKIGLFMVLFRTAYTLGIEPFFFSHAGHANAPETYATITKYFVIFGSFICLTVIATIDLIKEIVVPQASYWTAIEVVPLIVFANFFLGIYTNLSVWYKLIDKTHIGAYISLIGAAVTLVLNLLLIPSMSFYGSAIATIAAYGSMMVISYYLGRKSYPIPYDFKRIFTYLLVTTVFSALVFYWPLFRASWLLKILLLFIFAGVIYYAEKETIQKLTSRFKKSS